MDIESFVNLAAFHRPSHLGHCAVGSADPLLCNSYHHPFELDGFPSEYYPSLDLMCQLTNPFPTHSQTKTTMIKLIRLH